jgi:hypothetical protein
MSASSAAVALFSAIALYATYLGTAEAKWSIYLAGASCLCIAGWQAASFVALLKLRSRLRQGREGLKGQVEAKQPLKALEHNRQTEFIGVQSIGENTTDLLEFRNHKQSER